MDDQKKEWIETFVGGGLGVIAIISAIIEFRLGDNGALAGCIKDVAGTMIIVILLIVSIKIKPRNIEARLKKAVTNWGNKNIPLIFKMNEDGKGHYLNSYALLTDNLKYIDLLASNMNPESPAWEKYKSPGSHETGHFIEMPVFSNMTKEKFEVSIHMEQKHFDNVENKVIQAILNRLSSTCENVIAVSDVSKNRCATITFKKIETDKDISQFIDALTDLLSVITVIL